MATLEEDNRSSTGNDFYSIQLHEAVVEPEVDQSEIKKLSAASCRSKQLIFCVGIGLTLGGITTFLVGAFSNSWIVMAGEGQTTVPHPDRLLHHLGPWQACTHTGHCAEPWLVAPGLGNGDKSRIQGSQTTLILSTLFYLTGAALIILRLAGSRLTKVVICRKLLSGAVPEALLALATVLAFLSILLMGEIKQRLLPYQHQTVRAGWALLVCLAAIIATVLGAVLLVFSRHTCDVVVMETSSLREVMLEVLGFCWQREDEGMKQGGDDRTFPHTRLDESDIGAGRVGEEGCGREEEKTREGEVHQDDSRCAHDGRVVHGSDAVVYQGGEDIVIHLSGGNSGVHGDGGDQYRDSEISQA